MIANLSNFKQNTTKYNTIQKMSEPENTVTAPAT